MSHQSLNIEVIKQAIKGSVMDSLTFDSFEVLSVDDSNSVEISYTVTVSSAQGISFFATFFSTEVSHGDFTILLQFTAEEKGAHDLISASSSHVDIVCSNNCVDSSFPSFPFPVLPTFPPTKHSSTSSLSSSPKIPITTIVIVPIVAIVAVTIGYYVMKQYQPSFVSVFPLPENSGVSPHTASSGYSRIDLIDLEEGIEIAPPSAPPIIYCALTNFPPAGSEKEADFHQATKNNNNYRNNNSNKLYRVCENDAFHQTVVVSEVYTVLPEGQVHYEQTPPSISIVATVVHPNDFSV
jgi:hypothetical protein